MPYTTLENWISSIKDLDEAIIARINGNDTSSIRYSRDTETPTEVLIEILYSSKETDPAYKAIVGVLDKVSKDLLSLGETVSFDKWGDKEISLLSNWLDVVIYKKTNTDPVNLVNMLHLSVKVHDAIVEFKDRVSLSLKISSLFNKCAKDLSITELSSFVKRQEWFLYAGWELVNRIGLANNKAESKKIFSIVSSAIQNAKEKQWLTNLRPMSEALSKFDVGD